ncbi:MAG: hypothetical protein NVSMB24_28530 [Mucilaginibacter sp.]
MKIVPIKRVLILDDDAASLDIMERLLISAGFRVKAVEQTDDIFALIAQYKPDVLVVDYLLRGPNGGELCHQIKANPATSHIPVIITSAFSQISRSINKSGCDDFIEKPFDIYDFVDRVKAVSHNEGYLKQQ